MRILLKAKEPFANALVKSSDSFQGKTKWRLSSDTSFPEADRLSLVKRPNRSTRH